MGGGGRAALVATLLFGAACGNAGDATGRDGGGQEASGRRPDAGDATVADAARVDAGTPDVAPAPYPAPHAAPPQALSSGGPVLSAPRIVPIFFAADPLEAEIESFLGDLASAPYWGAVTSEYLVGPLTIAPSIVVSDPRPGTITDPEISAWLTAYLDGAHAGWPAVTLNDIYMVFYPSGTSITIPGLGASCTAFGGYHNQGVAPAPSFDAGAKEGGSKGADGGGADGAADAASDAGGGAPDAAPDGGSGVPFVYAVIPRCAMFAGNKGIDAVTSTTSHEAVEAATDPLGGSVPAYQSVDPDHLVWDFGPGGEIGDLCAYEPQSFQRLVGSHVVQRMWSNSAAAAGGDPCVPRLGVPYFNAAPDLPHGVVLTDMGASYATKGLKIPVGQTRTLVLRLFSSATLPDWNVELADSSSAFGGKKLLDFKPSAYVGHNGDVLSVQVTAVAAGPLGGTEFVVFAFTDPSHTNYWFGFVEN